MTEGNNGENKYRFLSGITTSLKNIKGVDLVYCLDNELEVVSEINNSEEPAYLEQVLNIIKSSEKINTQFYSKPFHTYTLLNEDGLIVLTKINVSSGLYVVVIGGEKEPVDLVNLLKTVNEIPAKISN